MSEPSRVEGILQSTIDNTEYTQKPLSRVEALLLELKEVIEEGASPEKIAEIEQELNLLTSRVDEIAQLPEGSTTGDAELIDIRVGADGKTYSSAGNAVRGQVGDLKSAFDNIVGIEIGSLTSGKYINRNDGAEGNDNNSNCSDFIPIISGLYVHLTQIYTTGVRGVALYDSNKVYKSKPSGQSSDFEFLVPEGVSYMRFTTYKDNIPFAFYSRIEDTLQDLFNGKLDNNLGASNTGKYIGVDTNGNLIPVDTLKGRVNSSNPLNANAIKDNGWYRCSVAGKEYFTNIPDGTSGVITLYTLMKVGGGTSQANQFVVDQQMSIWGRLLNTSNDTAITDWVKLVDSSGTSAYQVSRWFGKTIKCFGDSRTWYDGHTYNERTKAEWAGETCIGYQQTLARLTGATIQSDGHSGATSPTICDYIRAANLTGIDAVLLEGGVNDYIKADQVTIGSLAPIGSTFNTSTVYGAWQSAVEYILTNYPEVKIFMTVPAIAWDENGVMPYSTAEIKKNVAELYNIPCLDLYKNGGINQVNRDYYYVDDVSVTNWRLHFNDYGNALIGAEMAGFINTH